MPNMNLLDKRYMEQDPKYQAFLLRLWQAQENGAMITRASLEDPQTGQRIGFPSLEALIDFLQRFPEFEAKEKS